MPKMQRWLPLLVVSVLWFGAVKPAAAARVRFHYVPVPDGCGTMELQPLYPDAPGERFCHFGKHGMPYSGSPHPNQLATFCHLWNGATVRVPLDLPVGTPRLEHVWAKTVFNYGSYTVEVRFVPDGSVDVIYNSGPCRELYFKQGGPAPGCAPPAPPEMIHP
jgi:hypothetical protein